MTVNTSTPWWIEERPRSDRLLTVAELPARADVAIIGSGVTGLSAARRLQAGGASVAVIDAAEVAGGASAVNGGMVIIGLKAPIQKVLARYGEPLGLEFWEASLRSVDLVEEIVKEEAIDCAFSRCGAAELVFEERRVSQLAEEAAWHRRRVAFEFEVVELARLRGEVVDSRCFAGALVDTVSAGLQPAAYAFGLAEALLERGVALVPNTEVTGVARSGSDYRITTSRGTITAGEVLVATNGYTGQLLPGLRRGVVPIGSYIAVTEPLPAEQAERLIPGNRMLWTSRRLLNYFRRTPDDRILLGGRQNLSVHLDLEDSARRLRRRIVEFFPELATTAITHSWTGRLGVTFDLMPHIGRIDGVWYALGYGGHGVGIGTYLGSEVGGLISGELSRSPFAEIEHPRRWYYRSHPWFLTPAAWGYRALDRLGR